MGYNEEAVTVASAMPGVVGMWSELMKIAEYVSTPDGFSKVLRPVIRFLFPELSTNGTAAKYISTNMAANIFEPGDAVGQLSRWAVGPSGSWAVGQLGRRVSE